MSIDIYSTSGQLVASHRASTVEECERILAAHEAQWCGTFYADIY